MKDRNNCEHNNCSQLEGAKVGVERCSDCGETFWPCPGCNETQEANECMAAVYHARPLCPTTAARTMWSRLRTPIESFDDVLAEAKIHPVSGVLVHTLNHDRENPAGIASLMGWHLWLRDPAKADECGYREWEWVTGIIWRAYRAARRELRAA